MKTAKEIADNLFSKLKSNEMNFYEVVREVENGWLPNGTVPFDVRCRNGVATFSVYASSKIAFKAKENIWESQVFSLERMGAILHAVASACLKEK
jgi:hypothetical protein